MSSANEQIKKLRAETNRRDEYEEEGDFEGMTSKAKKRPTRDSNSNEDLKPPEKRPFLDKKPAVGGIGATLLMKHGCKEGEGLGGHGQRIVEPIKESQQRGRTGLGHDSAPARDIYEFWQKQALARDNNKFWDESAEEMTVKETVEWIECDPDTLLQVSKINDDEWMVIGDRKETIDDETKFVDADELAAMLAAKSVLGRLSQRELLNEARVRANPYETNGSAFFQNRSAMRAANLDAVFGFIFSQEKSIDNMKAKNPMELNTEPVNVDRNEPMFYFADVCAGPGGFSEYMLWRKKFYNAKGFGFTLTGKNDFKLHNSRATSANYFEAHYGTADDGDVTKPANIDSFEVLIHKGTDGKGVHLMMADGDFCVQGKEHIREILSKRIYLCQLLVSLCIVREGGNFFCKLFDVFTPFSVGLVYLMYACYEKVSIHKPHVSRPCSPERYIVCQGLRPEPAKKVREYLKRVNRKLEELETARQHELGKEREQLKKNRNLQQWEMGQKHTPKYEEQKLDVNEVVPFSVLQRDKVFMEYIIKSNNKLTERQRVYLEKYESFANNLYQIDRDQLREGKLREECMEYWMIPNIQKGKNRLSTITVCDFLAKRKKPLLFGVDWSNRTLLLDSKTHLNGTALLHQHDEYECIFLGEKEPYAICCTGTQTFICNFISGSWKAVSSSNFRLPPETILLVDLTKSFGFNPYKPQEVDKTDVRDVIRILDADVIHGDDISELPYKERMEAAEKMRVALERVTPATIPLMTVAQRFRLNESVDSSIRSQLHLTGHRDPESRTFTEHGRSLYVRGQCFVNAEGVSPPMLNTPPSMGGPATTPEPVARALEIKPLPQRSEDRRRIEIPENPEDMKEFLKTQKDALFSSEGFMGDPNIKPLPKAAQERMLRAMRDQEMEEEHLSRELRFREMKDAYGGKPKRPSGGVKRREMRELREQQAHERAMIEMSKQMGVYQPPPGAPVRDGGRPAPLMSIRAGPPAEFGGPGGRFDEDAGGWNGPVRHGGGGDWEYSGFYGSPPRPPMHFGDFEPPMGGHGDRGMPPPSGGMGRGGGGGPSPGGFRGGPGGGSPPFQGGLQRGRGGPPMFRGRW